MTNSNSHGLIEAADSVLVVIDVQDAFLGKLPREQHERILNNVCWLAKVAPWSGIPLVVTAEELDREPIAPRLLETLPEGTPVFNKLVFGLAGRQISWPPWRQRGGVPRCWPAWRPMCASCTRRWACSNAASVWQP